MDFSDKDEFFDYYLLEHSNPICRGLHYVGTVVGTYFFAMAVVSQNWVFLLLGLSSGYLMAWIGHFFFEKNKPASFKYPWVSFKSDYRMFAVFLSGRMKKQLAGARERMNERHAASITSSE